ncbi:hypothetical protein BVRB_021820, partial [Beta vulgaris subsp. vulgaris]
ESAQAALSSLEERQREVFARITALQTMLLQQATLENAFERHRIQRVLALEQAAKDILNQIQLRESLETLQQRQQHPCGQPPPDAESTDVNIRNHIQHNLHSVNPR